MKMNIVVLNYSTGEVDIFYNENLSNETDVLEYLNDKYKLMYKASECNYIMGENLTIRNYK